MNWYRHPCSSCMHIFFTFALFTCPVNSLISYGARSIFNPTLYVHAVKADETARFYRLV